MKAPKSGSYERYRHVIKCSSKHGGRHYSHVQSGVEVESDGPCHVEGWYLEVFGNSDPYWRLDLLKLAEKYIKYTLQYDNGRLYLKTDLRDYISLLILRCGFRAKLKHIHRDINDVVKVLRVSPKVHVALGLDVRHGFSVFNGLCFTGSLAYPKMEGRIDRCPILLVKSFLSSQHEDNSCRYEEMDDVYDALESVDTHIDILERSGVKLLLCSSSVSSDIGKKLYLSGISCVCKVDSDILHLLGVAVDCPILSSLDVSSDLRSCISTIHMYSLNMNGCETTVALSLDAQFHGCTILYSKCHMSRISVDHMGELLRTALFRLQGLFEELTFVKDLGGVLSIEDSSEMLINTFRSKKSPKATASLDSMECHNVGSFSPCAPHVHPQHNATIASSQCQKSHYSGRLRRVHGFCNTRGRASELKWNRFSYSPRNIILQGQNRHNNLHFSDWLKDYITGVSGSQLSSLATCTTTFAELQNRSVLRCLRYYTKQSETCGPATRETFPISRYFPGLFLSDFLYEFGRCLQRNRCMSSNSCSEQLCRHHMHLETFDPVAPVRRKRMTLIVDNSDMRSRSLDPESPYVIRLSCRVCGDCNNISVHDLTFGRFLHMVLYDSHYVSRCGHSLFGSHEFSIHNDNFTITLRVQDVSNYQVGAWFNAPLVNCALGTLPLFSAGLSTVDRKLLYVSSKLSRLLEKFADISTEPMPSVSHHVPLECTNSAEFGGSAGKYWDPYGTRDFELLYLKDRSSTLSVSLRNLLDMLIGYTGSHFSEFIGSYGLEEVLPCRCKFSCMRPRHHLDPRNQWTFPLSFNSRQQFLDIFHDRNAFGVNLHPQLLEDLTTAISGSTPFALCSRCNQCKYSSMAEIELLNWLYIITGVVKCIGVKLNSLSVTFNDSVRRCMEGWNVAEHRFNESEYEFKSSASDKDMDITRGVFEDDDAECRASEYASGVAVTGSRNECSYSDPCTPLSGKFNGIINGLNMGAFSDHTHDHPWSGLTLQDSRRINLFNEFHNTASAKHKISKDTLDLCAALEKVGRRIDDGLCDLHDIYVQCISHLLLAQFWCPLDPMHVFMSVRSFFVSLTSICRGFTRDVLKSSDSLLLSNLLLIDNATEFVSHAHLRSTTNVSYDNDRVATGVDEVNHGSSSIGTVPQESISITSRTLDDQFSTGSMANLYVSTIKDSSDSCENLKLDVSRPSDVVYDNSMHADPKLQMPPVASNSGTSLGRPTTMSKYDSTGVWCGAWHCVLPVERLAVVSDAARWLESHTRPSQSLSSDECPRVESKNDKSYSLPLFIQNAFNVGISVGFLGMSPDSYSGDYSPNRLVSGMHKGCSKHVESLVCLDYAPVYQVRRDLGNLLSRALMSSEYLEVCQSTFHTSISGGLCHMGKCLLNYCKSKRYTLMSHLSSSPSRDDLYHLRAPDYRVSKGQRFGGLILNSLIFRYLRHHSNASSIFQEREYCIFGQDESDTDCVYSVRRWDGLHPAFLNNPWSSMCSSVCESYVLNLACVWESARIVTDNNDPGAKRANTKVLCPVSHPSYGNPLIVCNHRLFRYRWCHHKKDFSEMPVMDHYLRMLFTNIPSVRDILRTVVDGTVQHLMSSYIRRVSTHRMLASVETHCDRLMLEVGCSDTMLHPCGSTSVKLDGMLRVRRSVTLTKYNLAQDSVDDLMSVSRSRMDVAAPVLDVPAPWMVPMFLDLDSSSASSSKSRVCRMSSLIECCASGMEWFRPPHDITSCQSFSLNYVHGSYTITVHYPEAFHMLRHLWCGDDISFARSLCRSSRIRCSGGKSGAFLSVSHDGKYILKLLNRHEFQLFLDKGERFFTHVLGGGTLLSIPYGLFSVEHKRTGGVVRCLIMQNIEHVLGSPKLTFDLKGISYKRYVNISPPNRSSDDSGVKASSFFHRGPGVASIGFFDHVVLLDQNFKDFTDGCPLHLEDGSLLQVFASVQRDLEFLSKLDVVDYSLLLRLFPEEGVIVLGIIDYLRPYTWDKQIETIGKKLANIASGQAPTIISPLEYKVRFMEFFTRSFSLPIEEDQKPSTPARVTNHTKPVYPMSTHPGSFLLDSLYTSTFVTSLYHFMRKTSPTAKLYLNHLMKSTAPCDDPEVVMSDIVRFIQRTYKTPAIDQLYSSL